MALENLKEAALMGKKLPKKLKKVETQVLKQDLQHLKHCLRQFLQLKTQTTERLCRLIQTARLHSLLFNSPDVRAGNGKRPNITGRYGVV
jgi:hypothetical protein